MSAESPRSVAYEARKQQVAALTRAGWSATRIANAIGVHPRSVWRLRGAAGVASHPGRPFTPDEEQRAEALFAEGESICTVADILGRNRKVVARHFPNAPRVDPREAGRRGALVRYGELAMRNLSRAA